MISLCPSHLSLKIWLGAFFGLREETVGGVNRRLANEYPCIKKGNVVLPLLAFGGNHPVLQIYRTDVFDYFQECFDQKKMSIHAFGALGETARGEDLQHVDPNFSVPFH